MNKYRMDFAILSSKETLEYYFLVRDNELAFGVQMYGYYSGWCKQYKKCTAAELLMC